MVWHAYNIIFLEERELECMEIILFIDMLRIRLLWLIPILVNSIPSDPTSCQVTYIVIYSQGVGHSPDTLHA